MGKQHLQTRAHVLTDGEEDIHVSQRLEMQNGRNWF